MRRYTVVLIPDADEGGYTALVPSLPGCVSEGADLESTLSNIRDAIQLYIEDLQASGEPIPEEATPPELATVTA